MILGAVGIRANAQYISFGFWRPHFLFTWMGGKSQQTLSGIYGTQGVASSSNLPGVRSSAATWIDSSGNLWLFGGYGYDAVGTQDELADLWEFTPSNGKWTWVSGINASGQPGVYGTKGTGSTSNYPGGRSNAAFWSDSSGNFWLFGGGGRANNGNWGYLDDLWEYTPSSNQWTWVSGSTSVNTIGHYGTKGTGSTSNYPGGRSDVVGWNDGAGNFWVFGGWGNDSTSSQSVLNDLWEYTIASGKWTWISGSKTVDASGTYGTKGTGATTNTPGGRMDSAAWLDASANLWLFGGAGLDSVSNNGNMNDLWEFTPSTKKWNWVAGANVIGSAGTFGTQGTGSTSNVPSARSQSSFAKDSSGNFWLYAGNGIDSASNSGNLNDQWKFNPTTLAWTWVTGSSTANATPVYGTKGTGSTSNIPGARYFPEYWLDSSGNSWVFGGYGGDNSATSGGTDTHMNDLWEYTPSNGNWTWTSGFNGNLQQGFYGTLGTASATNLPSARSAAYTWVDLSGNLWLFGGAGVGSLDNPVWQGMSDLWKYSPTTSQWTWMGGTSASAQNGVYGTLGTGSTSNIPGSRSFGVNWTDTSGNLWLFGGYGYDGSGNLADSSDLWKYNTSNSQWTWVSGPNVSNSGATYGTLGTGSTSNIPGCRESSASWIDSSGNLWLFGGYGTDSVGTYDFLSDLWKFNPTTLQWTWVSGPNIAAQSGTYGTLGTGSTSNNPGGRESMASWIDTSGNLWLFGGLGYDSAGNGGTLNDLWKFNPTNLQWTWMGGSNIVGAAGVYGTQGIASSSNAPGARNVANSWTDNVGNFWLMGGNANDSTDTGDAINDVWKYSPTANQWTWIAGSNLVNASGVYNTLGVTSLQSVLGARTQQLIWHDHRDVTWIFGGVGFDASGNQGQLNDFWKFAPL